MRKQKSLYAHDPVFKYWVVKLLPDKESKQRGNADLAKKARNDDVFDKSIFIGAILQHVKRTKDDSID